MPHSHFKKDNWIFSAHDQHLTPSRATFHEIMCLGYDAKVRSANELNLVRMNTAHSHVLKQQSKD